MNDSPYFAPLLDWQTKAWTQVTEQFYHDHLPHGLLASGMAGIGKRAFVWRFVAWLLCDDKQSGGACGVCQSCTWLSAGTHPDLMVLPSGHLPTDDKTDEVSIKIDDIRTVQEYSHLKGHGLRLIVLDNADMLTLGASNALLKTLEEPRAGVHLILVSDVPSRILPTVKSRVQLLPLSHIEHQMALMYLHHHLADEHRAKASMLLALADGAVLQAVKLPQMAWFGQRELWLKTWVSLNQGTRTPIVASDYWQSILELDDFLTLSRMMFVEMVRTWLGLEGLHQDLNVVALLSSATPMSVAGVGRFWALLDELALSKGQNVQDKVIYDRLFDAMATIT